MCFTVVLYFGVRDYLQKNLNPETPKYSRLDHPILNFVGLIVPTKFGGMRSQW